MLYFSIGMEAPFNLILISAEQDILNEAGTLTKLFYQGLETFHLRKPGWDIDQTSQFLNSIPASLHNKIVLHSNFKLTDTFSLKGIHLNESNKKRISELKQYNIVSASFHSLQDLKANTFSYQYIFLSPIFNSISKPGYAAKFDLVILTEEIQSLKSNNINLPKIIALGGINSENIQQVKDAGFSGAGLLGSIWQSDNPVESFLQIKLGTGR